MKRNFVRIVLLLALVASMLSGVQAGAKGKFGLTLGIARENNAKELTESGADFVVTDLEEVGGIEGLNALFMKNKA